MSVVKFKTETETLNKIKEILSTDPQGQERIQKTIVEAITKLHNKIVNGEPCLLLVGEESFDISPKKEHKQFMLDLTGKKGPYKVTKTYKSWVGLSEGVYAIENCDKFIPVSWCQKKTNFNKLTVLSIFLAISSLLQSGLLLTLLLA